MIESLPVPPLNESLCSADYHIFAPRFEEVLLQRIPTARHVRILTKEKCVVALHGVIDDNELLEMLERACSDGASIKVSDDTLVVPLPGSTTGDIVGLASGLDPIVAKSISDDWLRDLVSSVARQFFHIKQSSSDPVTTLLSGTVMTEILSGYGNDDEIHVVFVEMLPRARTPKESFSHVKRAARALKEHNRQTFLLFHLGQGVFAVVIKGKPREFLKSYCLSLLTFLKRKGFKRVHCGSSSTIIERPTAASQEKIGIVVLDEAWSALHAACKKGPFAFCDYDLLANPEHFPLKALRKSTLSKLQRKWKTSIFHSLVFLKPDYLAVERFKGIAERYFAQTPYVVTDTGFIVIRELTSADESRDWVQQVIQNILSEQGGSFSLSAGVSEYPFLNFSKTEIIRNCQKALVHAAFFGPGSVVVCDALSLNISGDLYFGEGDMAGAVREYRRGLELDGADTNLLNSLGVTYALMNRSTEAQTAFRSVLENDPDNFMAYYNLGLGDHAAGRYHDAVQHFTRAQEIYDPQDSQEAGALNDLKFQLGISLCNTGDYEASIEMLEKWFEDQVEDSGAGKSCRYIGIAYYHLDRPDKAIIWLQRALVFDEFDAESLSLLGELYYNGGQGNEIALKLCEKSVELESKNPLFLLRYAKILSSCGEFGLAVKYLRASVRNSKNRVEVWFELAVAYAALGSTRRARHYYKKLVNRSDTPDSFREAAIRFIDQSRKK